MPTSRCCCHEESAHFEIFFPVKNAPTSEYFPVEDIHYPHEQMGSIFSSLVGSPMDDVTAKYEHVCSTVKLRAQSLNKEFNNRSIQRQRYATTMSSELPNLTVLILIPLIALLWFHLIDLLIAVVIGFIIRRPLTVCLTRIHAWVLNWFERMKRRELYSSTTPFQTTVNKYMFRSTKIVNCGEPQQDHFPTRDDQMASKHFQTAVPLVKYIRPGGRNTTALHFANVKSVGIFGPQKVGKTTLLNKLFGLQLSTGNSANWQTTTGVDLTAISGYVVFDSEGAGSEDAMFERRHRLNNALPGQEDAIFDYVENSVKILSSYSWQL